MFKQSTEATFNTYDFIKDSLYMAVAKLITAINSLDQAKRVAKDGNRVSFRDQTGKDISVNDLISARWKAVIAAVCQVEAERALCSNFFDMEELDPGFVDLMNHAQEIIESEPAIEAEVEEV